MNGKRYRGRAAGTPCAVVDDETDIEALFRQRFRREIRSGEVNHAVRRHRAARPSTFWRRPTPTSSWSSATSRCRR